MGAGFWAKRFLVVLLGAFLIIGAAQWLKGNSLQYSVTHGGVWGLVTATVFTVARFFQSRRGEHWLSVGILRRCAREFLRRAPHHGVALARPR
jgi:hypothetical protein